MADPGALVALVGGIVAAGLAALRWLRIVQRDQYYPAALRFARRWWLGVPLNVVLAGFALAGAVFVLITPWIGLLTAAVVALGPLGLSLRGRTAPLVWSRRMVRLAIVLGALNLLLLSAVALGGALIGLELLTAGAIGATWLAFAQPLVVDLATGLSAPLERRLMGTFVERASRRLAQVAPTVVAITGSYGKTSTKGYVRHLLATSRSVVASPASYNNTGGLSRAINEHLVPGTEVFVAEMGTYGRGEIRELCRWIKPDVAVLTAIGPVHLERMGSLDAIVEAKSEIFERAETCVINVDAHGLAALADALAAHRTIWRCSEKDAGADVVAALDDAGRLRVTLRGSELVVLEGPSAQAINVACAVAVALALAVAPEQVAQLLPTLPSAEHRLQVASATNGATVIDDTYNSNPAGARAALAALQRQPAGRRVLVTPGMIELGSIQAAENEELARVAAASVDDLLIVNRINRAALLAGAAGGRANVQVFDRREEAVAWVRANLGRGDAVLYENDLPDTYP